MIRYAVFIEPEGEMKAFIMDQKSRMQTLYGHQPYGCHPPHCTLYMAVLGAPETWLPSLEYAIGKNPAFVVRVQESIVFYNDVMTGGGHTLALRAQRSDSLCALQECVGETLVPHVDRKAVGNPSGFLAREPYLSSVVKYGFPFVGAHWIPHFTIASLLIPRDSQAIRAFERQPFHFEQNMGSVSVWRVDNDRHDRIAMLNMGR